MVGFGGVFCNCLSPGWAAFTSSVTDGRKLSPNDFFFPAVLTTKAVKTLLCSPQKSRGVEEPCQGVCDLHPQEFDAADPLHCSIIDEVSRLQQEVQKGEQDFGTAEGQISTLKEAQDKLLEELDATRARLRETSNLLTALQGELETQKRHHEAKIITTKEEEKHKMDKMALELELKWTETLR
ncbi:hypothetical protein XENORESO_008131, partial [Xenotaenia resolanae]